MARSLMLAGLPQLAYRIQINHAVCLLCKPVKSLAAIV